ncbi:hypothetical protein [Nitrosovibrio tenuis]|uniref:Lipoprotein n=1 Tax=Nitrosovibrio tenuis TaxID=1233 RepID=A0A1H7MK75_9PROT|nr:hypothetical protein [Nitrosovibrio tenuis]SEL11511.1 hypothetical protein SAMN05216387_105115 [Nitrosovibrio tenuis]
MKKLIAPLLLSTVVVGCATTGGTTSRAGTAGLECGAVGAGGGFLACKLLGGSDALCAGVAAGAGVLGGGACYGFASHYEKRRQELAGKENDLDARLKYVRGLNEDSEKLNKQLNTRLAEVSRRTDEVSAEIRQGAITRQQVVKEREALQKEEQAAKDQVELQKVALDDMKRFQAQQSLKAGDDKARIAELDAEIAKQERLLAEAQRATTAFAAQAGRI